MLIAGFPAGAWGTNCYLVAPAAGEECVIIDPGHQAAQGVEDALRKHRLKPVAVVLTHGHIDHVASVVPVCGAHDVPAWIHPADRFMMSDPEKGIGRSIGMPLMGELTVGEPDDVKELADGSELTLAGLEFAVSHAPGHTKGSVTFRMPEAADIPQILFSGDLLFAGSIGRTDMPGGDHAEILESLARVCLPLDDSTVVLPGHNEQTTIGRERATNPYLRGLAAPRRGM
ncbi:MBL fold metallo-hydrolase [Streptomyces sp. NPDC090052]|uniref:MBL fold metallo-hydrolase n=1 Tax=unclassified Streptomyces TaxID=2593676 RepID=UPI0022502006|nr:MULTISPECIES: MBL fold metallo-hydrolase [unclassified Streptomyces]WSS48048.1 MBL fold metallo-hydrolase [Streptomyces sp. NBC_01180]WSV00393.1 MBL fold metallo-hydrolase [Streptomyces sp. NBC_01023]WSV03051.1 MBL fold metallo-hydrolase [Streptomyces sp. NBC_01020]WSX41079.1 MBL fold metallo-hydrolase [Streptomyces sp. NBC_00963]WSX70944.1 MBL fold metallo-hydrolase [Streptomyces sp. NBC_00932]